MPWIVSSADMVIDLAAVDTDPSSIYQPVSEHRVALSKSPTSRRRQEIKYTLR